MNGFYDLTPCPNKCSRFRKDKETLKLSHETKNVIYVSAKEKRSLKPIQRKPYLHFLVDVSKDKNSHSESFIRRIEKLLSENQRLAHGAKISFVNSYVHTSSLKQDWKQNYQSQTFEGGYFLDRAIRKTLFNAYKGKSYPVIVAVTDKFENAILDKDFSDFKFAFPESEVFFNLTEYGELTPHSLTDNPTELLIDSSDYSFDRAVLEYTLADNSKAYLPNNHEASIILKNDIFDVSESHVNKKSWESALILQGLWRSQILHPETSDKKWLDLVKYSFMSKVMTPHTSYLVVENEAQKAILKKKQEQVLSGKKYLDLSEDTQRMSEPSLVLLIVLVGLILFYREKRKRRNEKV
jgi:hypothetical protein